MRRQTAVMSAALIFAAVHVRAFTLQPAIIRTKCTTGSTGRAATRSFSSRYITHALRQSQQPQRTFAAADPRASASYSLDPHSSEARELTASMGINQEQHNKLAELASLVVDWNSRINLVSRKECTDDIVFGRHVLPSAALRAVPDCPLGDTAAVAQTSSDSDNAAHSAAPQDLSSKTVVELKDMLKSKGMPVSGKKAELIDRLLMSANDEDGAAASNSREETTATSTAQRKRKRVADIGCGGGFPGLPLAIVYPNVDFLLVDSVGKKLKAVQDMADALGLDNVRVHHGRAEELVDDPVDGRTHLHAYDAILGRSVTALPRFCFWISDLMKRGEGKLMYIIGGDVEELVTSQVEKDVPIDDLLNQVGASDKRVLVLPASSVQDIASKSGEGKRKRGKAKGGGSKNKTKKAAAKGQWKKRDNTAPKQRGYESFNRFES